VAGIALNRQGWTHSSRVQQSTIKMPKENDLEGVQDQGGKHGGQKGMPKSQPRPSRKPATEQHTRPEPARGDAPDQGIVRDERGQEQPRDKARAQQVNRTRRES
jgi:hypothetical protein